MRLLFVVNNPGFGGGNGQIVRLREPLAARGWDVVAVTPAGAPAAERLREGGVEVEEVPLHRMRATPDPRQQAPFLATLPKEVAGLRALVRRREIDVVQAHGDTNPHAALAGHLERRAVVWQIYDTVTPPPLRRVTMPLVTRVADVITTWGRALGESYPGTERLGERWLPVFPPVDATRFSPAPDRRVQAREELGIPEGATAVGVIAMRNPSKGLEHFVRALARARGGGAGEIVGRVLGAPSPGHPEYERAIREEAASLNLDTEAFDMRDAGARIAELLPAFDVLALTSVPRSEGMPTVILEGMACALPVVATDVGAVKELVDHGRTGYVVAPLDERAIADRLTELAADAALRDRLGQAGRKRFQDEFSLDALADRHVRAYDLALAHRRMRRRRAGPTASG